MAIMVSCPECKEPTNPLKNECEHCGVVFTETDREQMQNAIENKKRLRGAGKFRHRNAPTGGGFGTGFVYAFVLSVPLLVVAGPLMLIFGFLDFSSGDPKRIQRGKGRIVGALSALLLWGVVFGCAAYAKDQKSREVFAEKQRQEDEKLRAWIKEDLEQTITAYHYNVRRENAKGASKCLESWREYLANYQAAGGKIEPHMKIPDATAEETIEGIEHAKEEAAIAKDSKDREKAFEELLAYKEKYDKDLEQNSPTSADWYKMILEQLTGKYVDRWGNEPPERYRKKGVRSLPQP